MRMSFSPISLPYTLLLVFGLSQIARVDGQSGTGPFVYDLSNVSPDNPSNCSCDWLGSGSGCLFGVPSGSQWSSDLAPVSYCYDSIAWRPQQQDPQNNPTVFFHLESCGGPQCSAKCTDSCDCIYSNGTSLPLFPLDMAPAVVSETRAAPLLTPEFCTADEQTLLDATYSPMCSNYMMAWQFWYFGNSQCDCSYAFCNGIFLGCGNETYTCDGSADKVERCVFSDGMCPIAPSPPPPIAPPPSIQPCQTFVNPNRPFPDVPTSVLVVGSCVSQCTLSKYAGLVTFSSFSPRVVECQCGPRTLCLDMETPSPTQVPTGSPSGASINFPMNMVIAVWTTMTVLASQLLLR